MRKMLLGIIAVACVGAIALSIWRSGHWGPERVCDMQHSTTFDGGGRGRNYPTIESALARSSRLPGVRGQLPPESVKPTDEIASEFGATINPDFHADTPRGRVYDIWADGNVVQSVTIDSHRGGWSIGGYGGCSPIP